MREGVRQGEKRPLVRRRSLVFKANKLKIKHVHVGGCVSVQSINYFYTYMYAASEVLLISVSEKDQ